MVLLHRILSSSLCFCHISVYSFTISLCIFQPLVTPHVPLFPQWKFIEHFHFLCSHRNCVLFHSCLYHCILIFISFYKACSNETCLCIILGGVETGKNSHHGCSGSHPIDTLANGFPHTDFPGLLLEPLHHCSHDEAKHMEVTS
jgi:hypothetical protein